MDICPWTMRILMIIGFFGGVALGEYGWRPKQEYKFSMEGRSLAGVTSLMDQYTGIHYHGVLRVQSLNSNTLLMKMQNMTYSKVHGELELGWRSPLPQNEENTVQLPVTDTTFILKMDKGVVDTLTVSRNLEDWEVNFIQGLASKLQLDLSGSNIIRGNMRNTLPGRYKAPDVYYTIEDSVMGRCEVLYEVYEIPRPEDAGAAELCGSRPFLEITKTLNHSNCEKNPEYHFGLPGNLKCQPGGNQCGQFWTRATVSRTIGCGSREDMIFLSSNTASRVTANLNLHNNTQSSIISHLNLTLTSAHSFNKKFSSPQSTMTIRQLMYRFTPSDYKEKPEKKSTVSNSKDKKDIKFDTSSSTSSSEEYVPKKRPKRRSSKSDKRSRKDSDKEKHSERKDSDKEKPSETRQKPSNPSESDPREHGLWNMPQNDSEFPNYMPFDAFALAHGNSEERSCLGQQLKEIIIDIANDLESWDLELENLTLEKVMLATKICRSMSYKDLVKSVGIYMDTQLRTNWLLMTERKLFRDVITMCGTNPSFRLVKSWIEEQKLKGEEAVSLVSFLPSYLISPSSNTIDQFYEMIRHSSVKDDPKLKTASVIAFSNLLRVACTNRESRHQRFPYHISGDACNAESAEKYIPYMSSQLRGDPSLRPVFLMALGNTGSLQALNSILLIANDSSATPYLRARAIIAMKHLVLKHPDTMGPKLLSIYDNKKNPEIVRLASVSLLFFSKPSLTVWQSIAAKTWYEPSPSIQTFVYTTVKSLAQSKDTQTAEMSQAAAAVLSLIKPVPFPPAHHAQTYMLTSILDDLQEIFVNHISWSGSIKGSNFYLRQTRRIAGFSRVGLEVDFWVANPNAFVQSMLELIYPKEDPLVSRPPIPHLARSTRWLRETLKIAPRSGAKLEGDLQIRIRKLVERVFLFHKGVGAEISKAGKRLLDQLRHGKVIHKQSLGVVSFEMATVTDMGFPLSFRMDNPWMLRITGSANMSTEGPQQFTADFQMMYGENLQSELGFYAPFEKMQHVAAHYSERIFKAPSTRVHVGLNKQRDGIKVTAWPLRSLEKPPVIFKEIDTPFTADKDVLHYTTMGLSKNFKPVRSVYTSSKEESIAAIFKYKQQRDVFESAGRMTPVDPASPMSVFGFSMVWPDLSSCKAELLLEAYPPVSVEFGIGKATVRGAELHITLPKAVTSQPNVSENGWNPSSYTNDTNSNEQTTSETTVEQTNEIETQTEAATTETPPSPSTKGTTQEATTASEDNETTSAPPETTLESEADSNNTFNSGNESLSKVYKITKNEEIGSFNASTISVLEVEDNGGRIEYILRKILGGIEGGKAYAAGVLATVMEPEPKTYGAYLGVGYEISQRLHRAGLFLFSQKEEQVTYGVTATMKHSATPLLNLEKILKDDLTSHLYIDVAYPGKELLSIIIHMLRSEGRTNKLEKEPIKSCISNSLHLQPDCRDMARKSSTLDLYNFTFLSKDVVQQVGDSYLINTYLKRRFYQNFAEEKMDTIGMSNRGNAVIGICPGRDCLDAVIRLPDRNIRFNNVPVDPNMVSAFLMNPVFGPFGSLVDKSYCSLEQNKIATFDGVTYDHHFGNCWHLLAKDCSGYSRIAILMKPSQNMTELEINLDNYRVLHLMPGPKVELNGKPLAIEQDQFVEIADLRGESLMILNTGTDKSIEVKMPIHEFTVIYGEEGVVVRADRSYRGRLCGLCGDYDGELVNEWRKAGGEVATSAKEFALSYAFKEGSCQLEHKSN